MQRYKIGHTVTLYHLTYQGLPCTTDDPECKDENHGVQVALYPQRTSIVVR